MLTKLVQQKRELSSEVKQLKSEAVSLREVTTKQAKIIVDPNTGCSGVR